MQYSYDLDKSTTESTTLRKTTHAIIDRRTTVGLHKVRQFQLLLATRLDHGETDRRVSTGYMYNKAPEFIKQRLEREKLREEHKRTSQ